MTATVSTWFRKQCAHCGADMNVINGAWLRARREAAGLSIRDIARSLGLSAAYICDIELNRRNCPERVEQAYRALRGSR